MNFVTSIAPRHHFPERQFECTASWVKYGKVYSVNSPKEIPELIDKYPHVNFVETGNTHEHKFGKPYVGLDAALECILTHGDEGVLINSDIELTTDDAAWDKAMEIFNHKYNFLYLHRHNFDLLKNRALIYRDGIDVFFFHRQQIEKLPKSDYCIGHCYFDIMLPWFMIMAGYKVHSIQNTPVAYHKIHPVQYKAEDWDHFGQYTAKTFLNTSSNSARTSEKIYRFIRANTKYS